MHYCLARHTVTQLDLAVTRLPFVGTCLYFRYVLMDSLLQTPAFLLLFQLYILLLLSLK